MLSSVGAALLLPPRRVSTCKLKTAAAPCYTSRLACALNIIIDGAIHGGRVCKSGLSTACGCGCGLPSFPSCGTPFACVLLLCSFVLGGNFATNMHISSSHVANLAEGWPAEVSPDHHLIIKMLLAAPATCLHPTRTQFSSCYLSHLLVTMGSSLTKIWTRMFGKQVRGHEQRPTVLLASQRLN